MVSIAGKLLKAEVIYAVPEGEVFDLALLLVHGPPLQGIPMYEEIPKKGKIQCTWVCLSVHRCVHIECQCRGDKLWE